ncbi:hypothetical protein JBE04_18060 [Streptomyces sp. PRKS01-29]|nr:hypothetical protein [Streptomyces sabulosicollis]MBI0296317.1 hypothetical protein [Streptomyces sabulosicollis]
MTISTHPSQPVAAGYTLHDLDHLAKTAAGLAPAYGLDGLTRYQTAWSAIAEHLVTAEQQPTRRDLVGVGWQAINEEIKACAHARGYLDGLAHNGTASSPRYVTYWHEVGEESAVDRLLDHLAAVQIGDRFSLLEGRVVEALARYEDHARAAAALGMSYGSFSSRLSEARRRFSQHWYAPDTPPPARGHDKRRGNTVPRTHCDAGHEMVGDNVYLRRRKGRAPERVCRACERARSVARWQQQKVAA